MAKYCCDKMESMIEKKVIEKVIEFNKNSYYLIWEGKAEDHFIDKFELIKFCPFCGKAL